MDSIIQQMHSYDNSITTLNSKQAARSQDFVASLNNTQNLHKIVTEQTEYGTIIYIYMDIVYLLFPLAKHYLQLPFFCSLLAITHIKQYSIFRVNI